MKSNLILTSCLLGSSISVVAQSITIDDFAYGPLAKASNQPGHYSFAQTGPETSILGGTRQIDAYVGSGYTAIVSTTSQVFIFDNRASFSDPPPAQTIVSLTYGSAIAPLSLALRAADTFEVPLTSFGTDANIGFQWTITTDDTSISLSPVMFTADLPATLLFPLTDLQAAPGLNPADLASIESLSLNIIFPDEYSHSPTTPPFTSRLRMGALEVITPVPEGKASTAGLLMAFGLAAWRLPRHGRPTRGKVSHLR